jgi:aryl-alcohol dehydrogenase-like predicted oxidoreductase
VKYLKLGWTGLDVSRICLGCMSYGDASRGGHPWVINEEGSRPFFRQALDAGINFFDTANVYSSGSSEEFLGRALTELGVQRDAVVIATKVYAPTREGPNGFGLSRKAILAEVDNSLRRLNTDFIDLYQIHRLDDSTPLEETLEALHDVVKAGKVRYLGASSMWAWQFAKALFVAEAHGWTKFVSMQDHYNLLNREEEREMLPFCVDQGVGVIPWSPLARGRLARPWEEVTERSTTDAFGSRLYSESTDRQIVERVAEVAEQRGVPMAQIATAWMLSKPVITAPIIGATKARHIDDAVAAVDLELSSDEIASLEEPYQTHVPAGFA